jgi:hypothetical protein
MKYCWTIGTRVYHRLLEDDDDPKRFWRQSVCGAVDDIDRYFTVSERRDWIAGYKRPCKRCFPSGEAK